MAKEYLLLFFIARYPEMPTLKQGEPSSSQIIIASAVILHISAAGKLLVLRLERPVETMGFIHSRICHIVDTALAPGDTEVTRIQPLSKETALPDEGDQPEADPVTGKAMVVLPTLSRLCKGCFCQSLSETRIERHIM